MKMNCAEIQQLLYRSEKERENSENWTSVLNHINKCTECGKVYNNILNADALLDKLKNANPRFIFEDSLAASIMEVIEKEKHPDTVNVFDYLIEFSSHRTVKMAFGLLLMFCTLSFIYMEYSDTKQIVALEQKIGTRWNQSQVYAGVVSQEESIFKFFYDTYKLFDGKSSYLEINKELILMRKQDLRALFEEYNKLDGATKLRLNEMRNQLLGNDSSLRRPELNANEIIALRMEVERLSQELKSSLKKRGLK